MELRTLALVLPLALLAACSKPAPVVVQQPRGNMALQGIPTIYVCYEHEESALLGRLLALELGELPHSEDDMEMEKLRSG